MTNGRSRFLKSLAWFEGISQPALLAGLLIRLLLMPFATHSDLMHTYWGAHLTAYHHEFTMPFQVLLHYFHAVYLWLISPLLPPADMLWLHSTETPSLNPFFTPAAWFNFINYPQVFRNLFLLKIPYLFFDLACLYFLYHLDSDKTKSTRMFKLWWFNPILIFATYIFSRHEVITLFFILLSLYLIRKGKLNWGFLALGLAISIRYYALFLLPFYVLSLPLTAKKRGQMFVIGLFPWLIINLITWITAGSFEAELLPYLQHDRYLLGLKLQIANWDNLYIFPLGYFLLLLHRLYNRVYSWQSLRQYCTIAILFLFVVSYTGQSPHYWTWFLPWVIISLAEDRQLLPLHGLQLACLVIYSFMGNRATTGYLFAPIAPDLFWSLPSPIEIISCFASPEVVISLAHTAFSAITLWMIYLSFTRISVSLLPYKNGDI